MKKIRPLATAAALGALSLGTAGVGVTAASAATAIKSATLNHASRCSQRSVGDLQVLREPDGSLRVDVGVAMGHAVSGVPWRVLGTDNATVLAATTVRTVSDGSFSITRMVVPRAGADHVVFVATNQRTGEVCALNGVL